MEERSLRFAVYLTSALSAGLFGLAILNERNQSQQQGLSLKQQQLRVSPGEVIGPNPEYSGKSNSLYTLVEFGDYECPPCHTAFKVVQQLLNEHPNQINLVFRNMPLTSIHPFAMQAAVSAEACRSQGTFWRVHDELYKIEPKNFNSYSINRVISKYAPDQKRLRNSARATAMIAIENDVACAKKLSINGTPSFFLCCPQQKVYRLKSLTQVNSIIHSSE